MTTPPIALSRPCTMRYAEMSPREDGRARFCGVCEKWVHDLSSLTEREARATVSAEGEALCVRYAYDARGRVAFRPERRSKKRWLPVVAVAAGVALLEACGGAPARWDYEEPARVDPDATPDDAADAPNQESAGGEAED